MVKQRRLVGVIKVDRVSFVCLRVMRNVIVSTRLDSRLRGLNDCSVLDKRIYHWENLTLRCPF